MNSQHHREAHFTAPRPMRKSPLPLGLLPESVIRHTHHSAMRKVFKLIGKGCSHRIKSLDRR
jgi:hypothetical protein